MKTNIISEDYLYIITGNNSHDFNQLKKNPLIDKVKDSNNWFFEHRNIQEYFAASVLSELEYDEIVDFICIHGTKKTHPSLFNAITFLINIFNEKSKNYNILLNWFKENEPEILFKADSNRIRKELRISIFQEFFKRECIEKTLWINTKRVFDIKEIASFGDCKENFDFLTAIIANYNNYHFRVLYSALDLLNYFSEASFVKGEFKIFLMDNLNVTNFPINAKSQMLRIIQKHHLVTDDSEYMSTLYELFKNETHKQLNNSLLSLIYDEKNIDKYSEFLKNEFLMANNFKEREIKDDVIRGNKYLVNKLVFKFSNPKDFLSIIKHYFNNEYSLPNYDNYESDLVDKCVEFINSNDLFLIELLSEIKDNYNFYMHDNILKKMIKSSCTENLALNYFIKNIDINKIRFFISDLVSEDNIKALVKALLDKGETTQEIEFFRNNIGNSNQKNSRKLAKKFNDLMKENGIEFNEPVYTEEQSKLYLVNYKKHIQDNFDVLFDKKKLLNEIKEIFKKNNNKINYVVFGEIRRKWYEENGHANIIDTSLSILNSLISDITCTFQDVKNILEKEDFIIIKYIKNTIENYKNQNREFYISDIQKEYLKKWSLFAVNNIDFNEVAISTGKGSFRYFTNYIKIEIIFYFQKLFEFDLPKEFLLRSIEFYELVKSGEIDESFNYLINLVDNKDLFDKQIIDNLNKKELLGLSLSKHIEYALLNKLEEVYKTIRKHITNQESVFNDRKKIEDYVLLSKDTSVLKELCIDNDNYLFWNSIDIMLKQSIYIDFCREKAIEYLETDKEKHIVDALSVLMQLNDAKAFDYVLKSLKKGYTPSFHSMGIRFSNFDKINGVQNLIELFDLIYNKEIDQFESSYYRDFYKTIISNLSLNEEGFERIQAILNKIKKSLINNDSDLFYINTLIDDSINSYINSKSNPYTFKEAKEKAFSLIS